jgi:putative transposase
MTFESLRSGVGMARPLRIEFPGAIYHVTTRGNAGEPIVRGDGERQAWLTVVGDVVDQFHWLCHAYCLMSNHYHLLVETPEANLSRGMRQLNGVFTQLINRRSARFGHLFQGRFKAILVERESYLLELCRYLVLNPVRAGLVDQPERYQWSSYRTTCGLESEPGWLAVDWVLAQFGDRRSAARRAYREFVQDGVRSESPWAAVRGQIALGDRTFVEALAPLLRERPASAEIPRRQRGASRPELAALLPADRMGELSTRNLAMRDAHLAHGYSLVEIGRHVGLHYATVSRIIKGLGARRGV